jgi:hypothetical protein
MELCTSNAEFEHFILRLRKKFPYFADTTEGGDSGVKDEGDFRNNFVFNDFLIINGCMLVDSLARNSLF